MISTGRADKILIFGDLSPWPRYHSPAPTILARFMMMWMRKVRKAIDFHCLSSKNSTSTIVCQSSRRCDSDFFRYNNIYTIQRPNRVNWLLLFFGGSHDMIFISRSLSLSLLLRNGTMSLFIVGDVAVCIYLVYLVFVNVINDHCMIIKRHTNDTRSRLLCYKSVCLLATISSAREGRRRRSESSIGRIMEQRRSFFIHRNAIYAARSHSKIMRCLINDLSNLWRALMKIFRNPSRCQTKKNEIIMRGH